MKDELYGRLSQKVNRRKVIDTWHFRSPFNDGDKGYSCDVRLIVGHGQKLSFRATSEHFAGRHLEDTDIQKLRDRVEEAFQLADMAAREIQWERWIEIEIDGPPHHFKDSEGSALGFTWRFLKRGLHPTSGKVFTIHHFNNVVIPFPSAKRGGEKDPDADAKRWLSARDEATQYAYIPATKANIAALTELRGRIDGARTRLTDLLTQERVQQSLASIKTLLLEAPVGATHKTPQ
jgi:hypothetical protein